MPSVPPDRGRLPSYLLSRGVFASLRAGRVGMCRVRFRAGEAETNDHGRAESTAAAGAPGRCAADGARAGRDGRAPRRGAVPGAWRLFAWRGGQVRYCATVEDDAA